MGISMLYKSHVSLILLLACIFPQYSSAFLPGKGHRALVAPIRKNVEHRQGKFTGGAAHLMVPPIPQADLLISDASNVLPSSMTLAEGFISTIQTLITLSILLVAFRAIAGPVVEEDMEGTAVDAFSGEKGDFSVSPVLKEEPKVEAKKIEVETSKDDQAEKTKEKEAAEKAKMQEEKRKADLKAAQEAEEKKKSAEKEEEKRKAAAQEKEAQRIAAEMAQKEAEEKAAAQKKIEKAELEKATVEKARLAEEKKKAEAEKAKQIEEEEKAALERAQKLKEQQQADMEMVKAYAKEKEKVNKLKRTLEDNGKNDKIMAPAADKVKTNEGKGRQGTNVEEALSMAVAKNKDSDNSPSKSSKKRSLLKSRSIVVAAIILVLGGRLIRVLIGRGMV